MNDQQFVLLYDMMSRLVSALERQATTSRETAEAAKEQAGVYEGEIPPSRFDQQSSVISQSLAEENKSTGEKKREKDMVEGISGGLLGGMRKQVTAGITGTMLDLLKNETAAGNVVDVLAMRKEAREESFRLANEWGAAGRAMSDDESKIIATGRKRIADIKMGNYMNVRRQFQDPITGYAQDAIGSAVDGTWQSLNQLFQINQNNKMQGK